MSVWKERLIKLAFWAAIIGAVLTPLAGLGTRLGLWTYSFGFQVLQAGLVALIVAAVLAIIGVIWSLASRPRDGLSRAFLTLIIVAAVVAIPANALRIAFSGQFAPIHDISTDVEDPPQFVEILPLRGPDTNTTVYADKIVGFGPDEGKHYSEIQAQFYPDVESVILTDTPADAFVKALATVDQMGWELVAADADQGRIEATDTTFWFGFKDDVVIRLREQGEGTRLDIRSSSRVGMGDVGANVTRIRAYVAALTQ